MNCFTRACLAILAAFSSLILLSTAQIQRLNFYNETNCQGLVDTIYNSNSSLGSVDHIANADEELGVCGLWQFKKYKKYPDGSSDSTVLINACRSDKQPICYRSGSYDHQYISATRYGSANMRDPVMGIFTKKNLVGSEESFVGNSSQGHVLPSKFRALSWYVSGDHEYSLYEERDFSGPCVCLPPNETHLTVDEEGPWGMSHNWESDIVVGSIKYGCEDPRCNGDGSSSGSTKIQIPGITLLLAGILFKFVSQ